MRKRAAKCCMILGTVLVMAALFLFLWNQYEDWRAKERTEETVGELEAAIGEGGDGSLPDPYDEKMQTVNIDGYEYIGYVTVPVLELHLPVMAEWDRTRLQIAPCRYAGSVKTDDLVIAAHNYRSHFGAIGKLQMNDEVMFTDVNGTVSCYKVAEIDTLGAGAVEEMTSGEFDLTLFTCTYSGQKRVTVRCWKER